MLNNVSLVGRLAREPEIRQLSNGNSIGNITLAVNRSFKDKDGNQQADFINCVLFQKIAENTSRYVNKGDMVGIEGRIQTRNYENKEGQRIYVTEVVAQQIHFLQPKGNNSQTQNTPQYNPESQRQSESNPFSSDVGSVEINDSDLPF